MTIQLHSWPHSTGTRVAWALEELGVPYEYVEVDRESAQKSPGHLAIHPLGKVPGLVDDGQPYFESAAILLHLGERYGVSRGLWPAAGQPSHAQALCWSVWASSELGPFMLQYLYHGQDTPISFRPQDRSAACAEYNRGQLTRCLDALQALVAQREYMLGGFSLADVATASWLLFGRSVGLDLASHPRIADWAGRCGERPAYRRAR
jgi:glutathione S-transferase